MDGITRIAFTIVGTTPLVLHSPRGMLPNNPHRDELKAIMAKRGKKTDDDVTRMQRLEWENGLYLADDGKTIIVPSDCMFANICEAARASRKGKDYQRGLDVEADAKLEFPDSGKSLDALWATGNYLDLRFVTVNRAKVLRARPIFRQWGCTFVVAFRPDVIESAKSVISVVKQGGDNGFMEMRPRYGRYTVTNAEVIQA